MQDMPCPSERALILGAALLLAAPAARAQTPDPGAPIAPATTSPAPGQTEGDAAPKAPEPDSDVGKKKKKKDEAAGQALEFSGRVFALAGQSETEYPGGMDPIRGRFFDLQSARFGIKYEVLDGIGLNLELDFSGRPQVKDAFVQAKSKHLRARAGHFKMPISSITLESPWTLPIVDRGTIQDLLVNKMQVIGRRAGFTASGRLKGSLDPELTLGAFQGSQLDSDQEMVPLEPFAGQRLDSSTLFARATITPAGNEIGVVGGRVAQRDGTGTEIRHFWVAGADATIDVPFEGHGLRAWLEAITGTTWYTVGMLPDITYPEATYWSARGIVSWRWGGMATGDGYIEPFFQYGLLDPTSDSNVDGTVNELSAGLGVGYWRRARLTASFMMAKTSGDVPQYLFPLNQTVLDHKAFLLQAGAAF